MITNEAVIKEVEVTLKAAEQAIENKEWASANTLLKRGLDIVGDRHTTPDSIDDSGMKLVLAEAEEKKGALHTAAHIRRSVLASRLSLLRR